MIRRSDADRRISEATAGIHEAVPTRWRRPSAVAHRRRPRGRLMPPSGHCLRPDRRRAWVERRHSRFARPV